MKKKELLRRIDHLLQQGNTVLATKQSADFVGQYVDMGMQMGFRSASLSFINNLYGKTHPFFTTFDERVKGKGYNEAQSGISILKSIRDEVENDWLISIKEMVSAEIFSDFLEMSYYLLDQNYKDPAAVMIGSVLEENLRQLCAKNSVDTSSPNNSGDYVPKKADSLNSDLVKVGAYGVLEQKNVTAWLDLRNRAAHGKYSEYSKEQVDLMYQGVLNFIMTNK